MIRGLYTSSAGMQVEELRQEAIANNLANLNTAGFKRDMAVVEARGGMQLWRTNNPTTPDPEGPTQRVAIGTLGTGVEVQRFAKVFEQGNLRQTDNPLDVALPDIGMVLIQDSESGEQVLVDTTDRGFRRRFSAAAERNEAALLAAFEAAGLDVLELSTTDDLVEAVLRFANMRRVQSRLGAGGMPAAAGGQAGTP